MSTVKLRIDMMNTEFLVFSAKVPKKVLILTYSRKVLKAIDILIKTYIISYTVFNERSK